MKLIRTITALLMVVGLLPLAAQAQSAPTTQAAVATAPGKAAGAATPYSIFHLVERSSI